MGVTGAAGYIGSLVCYELKDAFCVIAMDNFYKGTVHKIGDIDVVHADIRDKNVMEKLLDVDCIVHLAAIPGVEPCNKVKELSYDVNVNGTRVLTDICKERRIPLLFATSFGTMGDPQYFPIDENHPKNPMHWYGQTKYHGEKIVTEAARHTFPCYLLIKSNIYGVHHINNTPVFKPTVINRFVDAVKAKKTLKIYQPGTQARNFLHVKDAAYAYYQAVKRIFTAKPGAESFCIATSEAVSIKEVAEKIVSIAEEFNFFPSIQLVKNPRTETLVKDFSVDTTKAKKELGFSPQYTIEKAVREMLE